MLISMKANIEDKGVKGDCTPLMEAANAGYVDIVQLLIVNGADVNAKSTAGETYVAVLNICEFFLFYAYVSYFSDRCVTCSRD